MNAILVFVSLLLVSQAYASDSKQPYIDDLKTDLGEPEPQSGSFIDQERLKLKEKGGYQGYSEQLRQDLPSQETGDTGTSYLEGKKAKLLGGSNQEQDGESAIARVKDGRSALEMKIPGYISGAFGLRFAASATRSVTASSGSTAKSFADIYGDKWVPDLTLFYEYQPFHSEWLGNVGLVFSGGLSVNRGKGYFDATLINPKTLNPFPSQAKTVFQFFTFPVMAGLNYRFNLLRLFRPYVQGGISMIGYFEGRNDSQSGKRGYSRGVLASGGVNILLDWFSRGFTWEAYHDSGIKHSYLTLDYSRLSTLGGDLRFAFSSWSGGLTYEF